MEREERLALHRGFERRARRRRRPEWEKIGYRAKIAEWVGRGCGGVGKQIANRRTLRIG